MLHAQPSRPGMYSAHLSLDRLWTLAPFSLPHHPRIPASLPQFIVLTNDDAITVISQPIILNITERHKNKNGCKMPAT